MTQPNLSSMLAPDFRDFVALLNDHSVRYLMIGGYAVVAYGFGRTTEDIDFCLGENGTYRASPLV